MYLALNQIDHTLRFTGSRCAHFVGSFGYSASECVGGVDESAGLTAFGVAWPVSGAFSDGREIMLLNDFMYVNCAPLPCTLYSSGTSI